MMTFNLSEFLVSNTAEAIAKARQDYKNIVGQIIYPAWLYGYVGDTDQTVDLYVGFKVGVRVVETSDDSVTHLNDEFCDPYWDVEIVDDPDGIASNLRSAWIHGISYETTNE